MGRGWGRAPGGRKPIAERIRAADKLFLAGKYGRAEPRFAEVVTELEAIHADDAEAVVLLGSTSYLLGVCRHRLGRNEEAAAALRSSMSLLAPFHAAQSGLWGRQLAAAALAAAGVERDLGRWPQALELSRRALDLWMELPGERSAAHRAFAMRTFAHVRASAGVELDEALRWVDEAITVQTALLAASPGQPHQHEVDVSQLVRTMVLDAMTRQRSPADGGTGH